jgi:hypothetical protein
VDVEGERGVAELVGLGVGWGLLVVARVGEEDLQAAGAELLRGGDDLGSPDVGSDLIRGGDQPSIGGFRSRSPKGEAEVRRR